MDNLFTENEQNTTLDYLEGPGDYQLDSILLTTITGDEIDLKFIFIELNIYEDLFANCVTGNIIIKDSLNLPYHLSFHGHETIKISFQTPTVIEKIEMEFGVSSITDIELEKERTMMYSINFISKEFFTNLMTKISKSWVNYYHEEIVQEIAKTFLQSDKEVTAELALNLETFIACNWTPFQTINWLAQRAIPLNSPLGANYIFYEDNKKFNFRSIEELFSQDVAVFEFKRKGSSVGVIDQSNIYQLQEVEYVFQPANLRKDGDPTTRELETDLRMIEAYSIPRMYDVLENLRNGLYANTILTHDIVNKQWIRKKINYIDDYIYHQHLEGPEVSSNGQELTMLCNINGDYQNQYNQVQKFVPKHPEMFDGVLTNNVDISLMNRLSTMQQLKTITIDIVVPGDSSRLVGEVVKLRLPSPEQVHDNQLVIDNRLSGKYLVSKLRHVITRRDYKTHLTLLKDSVAQPFPKNSDLFVVGNQNNFVT